VFAAELLHGAAQFDPDALHLALHLLHGGAHFPVNAPHLLIQMPAMFLHRSFEFPTESLEWIFSHDSPLQLF
jgi:hypothetical protein